jgi:hypothetical protein
MACVITDASGQRGTTPHTHADTHAATLLDAPDPTTWAAAPPALAPGAGGCGAEEDMAPWRAAGPARQRARGSQASRLLVPIHPLVDPVFVDRTARGCSLSLVDNAKAPCGRCLHAMHARAERPWRGGTVK